MRTVLLFVVFLLFLGLWTWKLLEPNPIPDEIGEEIPTDLKFILAKCLHAGVYAFLTMLAALLPVRRPYFWAAVGVLMLHGCLTEYLQYAMDVGRHGCVRDVIIDWCGITMGLLFLRYWRPR